MLLRPALLVLALAASSFAWGEALETPERIARLSYVEGEVAFRAASEPSSSALPDRPLKPGDWLMTQRGGKAELTLGTAVIRLDERTELSVVHLDAETVRVELGAGTASVHLRELLEDETFEVVTPNTTISFKSPGEYRVDAVDEGVTDFTVRAGAAEVATAGGPVRVADGQRVRIEGRDALASLATPRPADAFDDWVLEREVQFAQAEPPPGEQLDGYEDEALDQYGEWYDEPSYGRVWMPSYAYGGYDPFRYGYWQHVGFGYSWVNSMPWGFYTSHYGRWAYLRHLNRWCWVPERRGHWRQVARNTRPLMPPREFARPDNRARRDDDDRRPVAGSAGLPRRIDADRQPAYRPDVQTAKQSRSGTIVPSTGGGQNPPPRTTPVRQSSGTTVRQSGGTTTVQPSKPAQSGSQTRSRPAATTTTRTVTSSSNREFGATQTP